MFTHAVCGITPAIGNTVDMSRSRSHGEIIAVYTCIDTITSSITGTENVITYV